MTMILEITGSTTNAAIESAIPFIDMRDHAIERRDDVAALESRDDYAERGESVVGLELHEVGDVLILYSPVFGYACVNERSAGAGNSVFIDDVDSIEDAAERWRNG